MICVKFPKCALGPHGNYQKSKLSHCLRGHSSGTFKHRLDDNSDDYIYYAVCKVQKEVTKSRKVFQAIVLLCSSMLIILPRDVFIHTRGMFFFVFMDAKNHNERYYMYNAQKKNVYLLARL